MKESEVRRPMRAWAKRLSEIGREVKDLAKNANLRASVALGMIPLCLLGRRSYLVYAILSPLRRLWFCGLRLRDRILFPQLRVECIEASHHLLHD